MLAYIKEIKNGVVYYEERGKKNGHLSMLENSLPLDVFAKSVKDKNIRIAARSVQTRTQLLKMVYRFPVTVIGYVFDYDTSLHRLDVIITEQDQDGPVERKRSFREKTLRCVFESFVTHYA